MLFLTLASDAIRNVTLYRISPQHMLLTVHESAPSRLFGEFMGQSTQAVLLSEDCEYYTEFQLPTMEFHNSSCILSNESFYKLVLRSPALQANATIYVDRVVEDINALNMCIKTMQLFHDLLGSIKLWAELDCPSILVDADLKITLFNEEGNSFEADIQGTTSVVANINITLPTVPEITHSVIYDCKYLIGYEILGEEQVLLTDVETGQTSPAQQFFTLKGVLRNSLYDGSPCFTNVRVLFFDKDASIRFSQGVKCSPGFGSYYDLFQADSLTAELAIQLDDEVLVLTHNATGYNFGQLEFEYSCTNDCATYLEIHKHIVSSNEADLEFNAVFKEDETTVGIIRHHATLITPVFKYIRAIGYRDRVCVIPGEEPMDPSPILKEYNLLFKRSVRNCKFPSLKSEYYFSFSDFYPLERYCFPVDDSRLIYRLFKAEFDIIFIIDGEKYFIYNFEPYISGQYGLLPLGLVVGMTIPLAVAMIFLKNCYHGVS